MANPKRLHVTPEMIEAGYWIVFDSGMIDPQLEGLRQLIEEVFIAMMAVAPQPKVSTVSKNSSGVRATIT